MDAGHLIAIAVVSIYTTLGPLVLFAIYVLFDALAGRRNHRKDIHEIGRKEPAMWSKNDIDAFMNGMDL